MSAPVQGDIESYLPRFGLTAFRPGQREVISAVLSGEDCLCIMPTGGGKSLCYYLPAVVREGVALVVSPLIALMKDQVDGLQKLGVQATFVNSALSGTEQHQRLRRMAAGQYDLVYVAPERFRSPRFIEAVKETRVQLLAVDEAHCVSQWGHDFRPDYARLGWFRRQIGNPQTIALTATATEAVREDVLKQIGLQDARTFVAGFARPNLHCEVLTAAGSGEKDERLIQFLRQTPGSGIIYVSARKRCGQVAETIAGDGRRVGIYHAGMAPDQRRKAQDDFMSGRTDIVVATVAFGMGIDKADVRFVVHYNVPGSLEAYYQEAGRAGRDGKPSRCLLLFNPADRYVQEFFIENGYPSREAVARVWQYLREAQDDPVELTHREFKERLDLAIGEEGVGVCLQLLQKSGVIQRLEPRQNMAVVQIDGNLPTLVDLVPQKAKVRRSVLRAVEKLVGDRRGELIYFQPRALAASLEMDPAAVARALRELCKLKAFDYVPPFRGRAVHVLDRGRSFDGLSIDFEALQRRKAAEYDKLDRMLRYAQSTQCRQLVILRYFGDRTAEPCGVCDNCRSASRGRTVTASASSENGDDAAARAVVEAVKMVLSGVARSRGRFGKQLIAGMLWGSKSAKVARWKLDKLSTYGLLSHLAQDEVLRLIDVMMGAGLIEQTDVDRHRPVLRLTVRGDRVMRGKMELDDALALPAPIVEKLRRRRAAETPKRQRTQQSPPPSSEKSLATTADAREPRAERASLEGPHKPSHYWTWRLLRSGFTPEQCAEIRSLDMGVILDHALRAAENGLHVEPGWLLSSEQIAALEKIVGSKKPPQRIRPILRQLAPGTRYEHVRLFLECRKPGRSRKV